MIFIYVLCIDLLISGFWEKSSELSNLPEFIYLFLFLKCHFQNLTTKINSVSQRQKSIALGFEMRIRRHCDTQAMP